MLFCCMLRIPTCSTRPETLLPYTTLFRASYGDLYSQLAAYGIPGIAGFDTRRLTRRCRDVGAIPSAVGPLDLLDEGALLAAAQREPGTEGLDLVAQVSTAEPYRLADGSRPLVVEIGRAHV